MKKLNIELRRLYFRYLIITTDLLLDLRAAKARGANVAASVKLRPVRDAA